MQTNPVLYTQPGCGQCKAVHMLLAKSKLPYEEVTVTSIDAARAAGIQRTPSVKFADGTIITGKAVLDWAKGGN